MINVFIIDNENAIARFIKGSDTAVCVFDNEIRALNAVEEVRPGLVIINYTMQKAGTIEFISLLFNLNLQSRIILVAKKLTDDEILDCLAAGATGYLQGSDVEKFINQTIRAVTAGEAWISRRLVAKLLERVQNQQAR